MRHLVLIIALFLTISFAQDKVVSENYAIEGMMCSMGCVTKVTKATKVTKVAKVTKSLRILRFLLPRTYSK